MRAVIYARQTFAGPDDTETLETARALAKRGAPRIQSQ
jgi:hypothetical protein